MKNDVLMNSPAHQLLKAYRTAVADRYPDRIQGWPLLVSFGVEFNYFSYKGWHVVHAVDRIGGVQDFSGGGELPESVVGFSAITEHNKEAIRQRLSEHFRIAPRDGLLLLDVKGNLAASIASEVNALLRWHEIAMGLSPMKIFLSHKGADKNMVRRFKETLLLFGFEPWIDEDAMPAGTVLHRGILKGFEDSCAAIFFVTVNFRDESYLSTEVDYAVEEKQKKGEGFSIITLVFGDEGRKGVVPGLLKRYVWKEPKDELQALQEIIKALPLKLGPVSMR